MTIYARIADGVVAELYETDADIATMFHADLIWVDTSHAPQPPQQGWIYNGTAFAPLVLVAPVEPLVYIPPWLIRQRLEAANLWDAAVGAMSSPQLAKFCSLELGILPGDAEAVALLTAIGADPAAILALPA